jgi:hypothetical protein
MRNGQRKVLLIDGPSAGEVINTNLTHYETIDYPEREPMQVFPEPRRTLYHVQKVMLFGRTFYVGSHTLDQARMDAAGWDMMISDKVKEVYDNGQED